MRFGRRARRHADRRDRGLGHDADAGSGGATSTEPFEVDQVASSPRAVIVSGIDAWQTRVNLTGLPDPLVDFDEIRSGGPPPDGIPPIDEPRFLRPADVDFLADNEPVLALEIDGDARAYPVQIMTWHEIVNDTVGGDPGLGHVLPAVQLGGGLRPPGRRPGRSTSAPPACSTTRRS